MQKRLLKVAIATALTVAFAAPAFANPFSDVPAKHWAYAAVNKLAQAGVVDGYGDGTFRGDKTITRYEMAQIVAKAMNKDLNSDQKAIVDKLAKEYAVELNNLGVKVEGMQNQIDNMVKFSGDARVRYYNADNVDNSTDKDSTEYRVRLGATAKVNDTTSLYARITSGSASIGAQNADASIDNAYATTKILGLSTKIGRQDYSLGQGMLAGAGSVAIINGVSVSEGNFMAVGGKETNGTSMVNTYGAQYNFKFATAPISLAYLNQDKKDFYAAGTSFNLFPGFKVAGEYAKNETDNAKAYQVKASLGKTGLSVAYKDVERGAVPFDSALNLKSSGGILGDFRSVAEATGKAKGMEYEYNADLAKNTNLNLLYQDIKDAGKNVRATVNVKF
ncbi:S-layer homology domain-containing protein [Anaeroselena agilis]|uniref:S-layer homology domain-containing protein n=1 Tax=Anaeroselena agilis TaxID=3063788 RepID=A0ABU3P445_9FIRM|nr:S-layer homology domain-containing protein [Selenomonadales bacterium 4137-cl]